jgi:hypothetical protein
MSSTKIIVPVALLAAMAAATYFIQSRTAANQGLTPIILKAVPAAKHTQASHDDALVDSTSRKQSP